MNDILLVTKKSSLSIWESKGFLPILKENPQLEKSIHEAHNEHIKSLDKLTHLLNRLSIKYSVVEREQLYQNANQAALVIAAGGDGTFIHCSHYLEETPIIGVNTAPGSSVGHYCELDMIQESKRAETILRGIFENIYKPKPLQRLHIALNNKPLNIPILNDILITAENPASTCRYLLSLDKKVESHKSSGLWISTANGSSAAFASAGGTPFSEIDEAGKRRFGFIVREPYNRNEINFTTQTVSEGTNFEITSFMPAGQIFCDGNYKTRNFFPGDILKVSFSKKPLFAFRNVSI